MTSRAKWLWGLGLAVLLGGAAGFYGGFRSGRDPVLRDWIYKDARDLQAQVAALRHLRKSENEKAMEMFESRLDGQLLLLVPEEPYEFLTPRETSMLHKAISDMRDYRSEYPHQSGLAAEAARQTLAKDPYK
jgi:hypothetical protein